MEKAKLIRELSEKMEQYLLGISQPYWDNGDLNVRDLTFLLTLALGKIIWVGSRVESKSDDVAILEAKMDALIQQVVRILPECINSIEKEDE